MAFSEVKKIVGFFTFLSRNVALVNQKNLIRFNADKNTVSLPLKRILTGFFLWKRNCMIIFVFHLRFFSGELVLGTKWIKDKATKPII